MVRYEIHYTESNTKQVKHLIDHSEFLKSKDIFSSLDPSDKKYREDTYNLRKKYLERFGDFFTNESPLGQAMFTGKLNCNKLIIPVTFQRL